MPINLFFCWWVMWLHPLYSLIFMILWAMGITNYYSFDVYYSHHCWVTLSSFYGMVLVILMFAICLIEVMDNPVKLLSLQGIYLMYLYLGSIAVIICIYVWVLIDSCVSLTSDETEIVTSGSSSPGVFTLNRFNSLKQFSSLKRAHISRSKTSDTSFYLRVGALGKCKMSRFYLL